MKRRNSVWTDRRPLWRRMLASLLGEYSVFRGVRRDR